MRYRTTLEKTMFRPENAEDMALLPINFQDKKRSETEVYLELDEENSLRKRWEDYHLSEKWNREYSKTAKVVGGAVSAIGCFVSPLLGLLFTGSWLYTISVSVMKEKNRATSERKYVEQIGTSLSQNETDLRAVV